MHHPWTKTGRLLTVIGGAAALLIGFSQVAGAQETYELSGDAAAVWNLAGAVTVTGGGSSLAVTVTRGGADGSQLQVATGSVDLDQHDVGDVNALRVIYPADRIRYDGGGQMELRVRDDGTFYRGRERGREVKIREDGDGLEAHADLDIRVPAGRTLLVFLAAGEVTVSNVDGDLVVNAGSADVSSEATSGQLILDTGSGDVEVDGAQGEVLVDTGSGDVGVRDVSGPELNVDTGSGDVGGAGVTVSELNVDTGSGDVGLSGVEASEVSVDTGSGDVGLAFRASPSEVSVDTGSGDVTLKMPSAWAADIELNTASGDIESEFEMILEEMTDDYVLGRIGAGGGSVEVDTGSGDITLERG